MSGSAGGLDLAFISSAASLASLFALSSSSETGFSSLIGLASFSAGA